MPKRQKLAADVEARINVAEGVEVVEKVALKRKSGAASPSGDKENAHKDAQKPRKAKKGLKEVQTRGCEKCFQWNGRA